MINDQVTTPAHVSIIMDGNGRWAKARGLSRTEGHKVGMESVRAVIEFAAEQGIPYLSLFAFSEENWDRPKSEIEVLFSLMLDAMEKELPSLIENNVRLYYIGNSMRLPGNLKQRIEESLARTAGNTGLKVIIALSYSGKWDILQAARRYAVDCQKNQSVLPLSDAQFADYLSTAGFPDPDLLIRTSGEQRISNYMLWQLAYTEFYFTPILWPDFRKLEFEIALQAFRGRKRRFGKTEEQIIK